MGAVVVIAALRVVGAFAPKIVGVVLVKKSVQLQGVLCGHTVIAIKIALGFNIIQILTGNPFKGCLAGVTFFHTIRQGFRQFAIIGRIKVKNVKAIPIIFFGNNSKIYICYSDLEMVSRQQTTIVVNVSFAVPNLCEGDIGEPPPLKALTQTFHLQAHKARFAVPHTLHETLHGGRLLPKGSHRKITFALYGGVRARHINGTDVL